MIIVFFVNESCLGFYLMSYVVIWYRILVLFLVGDVWKLIENLRYSIEEFGLI